MGQHRFNLTPEYSISRLIVGGWQFSGGHGAGAPELSARLDLLGGLVAMGLTTFDCADIYTGVEALFGEAIRRFGPSAGGPEVQVHTKFVPDLDVLGTMDRDYVRRIIHRSLTRLGVERLDLVQFHWWDYSVPRYVEVGHWLRELQEEGKIRNLGVTNFDAHHLRELVDAGLPVVSNQVQYSVLDRRPRRDLAEYCRDQGISLLCYGGLSGGFLTETYLGLDKAPAQDANRSLTKYRLIIQEVGGWQTYQDLLSTLGKIAARHGVSIPAVALRYVLDQPAVGATITGLDSVVQAQATMTALDLELDEEDRGEVERGLKAAPPPPGPVYGLERDREGPHGRIMRYNLNHE